MGTSVRALARSATAAGYPVLAVDGFGDRDLVEQSPPLVAHQVVTPFDVAAIDPARFEFDAVAYTSNIENSPDGLSHLVRGKRLLGNAPEVLRKVRDPVRATTVLEDAGLAAASVQLSAREAARSGLAYLAKPCRGGGGNGVRRWERGSALQAGEYLQQFIEGEVGSIVFLADGHDIRTLGLTRQLCGDPAFGASGFRWCGNLLGNSGRPVLRRADEVLASAEAAARALTAAFGLRGINGIDFIACDGSAVPIEVNPRWTGAVELVERARGQQLFDAHVGGCEGRLSPTGKPVADEVIGKAVVFARHSCVAPDTDEWLADPDIRDVPCPGSRVPAGGPICTVLARGATAATCHAALADRAETILSQCELPAHAT